MKLCISALRKLVWYLLGTGVMRVSGLSMTPVLKDGDFILYRQIQFDALTTGDLIVIHHPHFGIIVKMIDQINTDDTPSNTSHAAVQNFLTITGTNSFSTTTQDFGKIYPAFVMGVVKARITPQGINRIRRSINRKFPISQKS